MQGAVILALQASSSLATHINAAAPTKAGILAVDRLSFRSLAIAPLSCGRVCIEAANDWILAYFAPVSDVGRALWPLQFSPDSYSHLRGGGVGDVGLWLLRAMQVHLVELHCIQAIRESGGQGMAWYSFSKIKMLYLPSIGELCGVNWGIVRGKLQGV